MKESIHICLYVGYFEYFRTTGQKYKKYTH